MNPVNPVSEPNVDGLHNRRFEAADNQEENASVKDKLYADAKQVASNITQLIRDGRTEEAKKLAETILNSIQSYCKYRSEGLNSDDDLSRLIEWINSTNEGDKVIGEKLKAAHIYFHVMISTLTEAEVNSLASTKDFKNTLSELEKIDVSAKDRIPLKNVNIAAVAHSSRHLAEYAAARVKPFFEISIVDSQPQVNLFGKIQSPQGDMPPVQLKKTHLKDNFYVSEYLHEFLQESVANKELTLESALNILLDYNDESEIKKILSSKGNEPLNEKLLDLDKILKMGPEYIKIFIDYLPDNAQQHWFDQAQFCADIDTQDFFISNNFKLTDYQKESYELQKKWFESDAVAQFPALKDYSAERQIFRAGHNRWYFNNQKGQDFFLEETNKSVKFALLEMNKWKNSNVNPEQKFENLLTSLGFRRGSIAYQSESREPYFFGKKRKEPHMIGVDLYGQAYVDRIKDLMSKGKVSVPITVDGKVVVAKYISYGSSGIIDNASGHVNISDDSSESTTYATIHNYPFWEFETGLFGCIARSFDGMIKKDNPTIEDLRVDIAKFHWFMANIVPFERGSASITEVLTDALWLMHGFVPQRNLEEGKTIDMEAILAPSLAEFVWIYPGAIDVRPQNNTNNSQIVTS